MYQKCWVVSKNVVLCVISCSHTDTMCNTNKQKWKVCATITCSNYLTGQQAINTNPFLSHTLFRDNKRPCHWKRFQQSWFIFCSFQSCFTLFVIMQNADILALAGLRLDGRRPSDIRSLKHNLSLVPTADGSAYLEQGFNKVLVMVHGPQEPKKRLNDQNADKCNIVVRISHLPFCGAEWKQRRNVSTAAMPWLYLFYHTFTMYFRVTSERLKWSTILVRLLKKLWWWTYIPKRRSRL